MSSQIQDLKGQSREILDLRVFKQTDSSGPIRGEIDFFLQIFTKILDFEIDSPVYIHVTGESIRIFYE